MTPLEIAQQVRDIMNDKHPDPTDAGWTVCWSNEDAAAAVVFQSRPVFGARPQVRARYLWEWKATLEAAGHTVEERTDGPEEADSLAPWWLRVTD